MSSRRSLFACVLAATLCGVLSALPVSAAPKNQSSLATGCSDESLGYQIDTAHTGVQNDTCLQPTLTRAWTLTLPGRISYPIIVGGRVYVTAADAIPSGSSVTPSGSTLYAFDLATGNKLWSSELGGSYQDSNAAYDDASGHIFTVNADGDLRAYDTTGTLLWDDNPASSTGPKLPNAGPATYLNAVPVASGGTVYLDGGSTNFVAVNESDGSIKWSINGFGQGAAPSVTSDGVYFTFPQDNIEKLSLTNGSTIWSHLTGTSGGGGGASVVAGGKVWVYDGQTEGNAPLLDAHTGNTLASWGPHGVAYAEPVVDAASGIALYRTQNGWIQAVDLTTGNQLWTFGEDGPGIPVIANGYVYLETHLGVIYALDEKTGREVWYDYRFYQTAMPQTNYGPDGEEISIGIGDGMLVAPAGNILMAYRSSGNGPWAPPTFTPIANQPDQAVAYHIDVAHSGAQSGDSLVPPLKPQWSRSFEGPVSYPLIADGKVFVTVGAPPTSGIDDSRLYALDAATGAVIFGPYEVGDSMGFSSLAYDQGRLITLNQGWLKVFDERKGVKLYAEYLGNLGPTDIDTAPVASNGTVYVTIPGDVYSNKPAQVVAIDEASGGVKWSAPVESTGTGEPGVYGSSVYTTFCNHAANLDAATGHVYWDTGAGGNVIDCGNGRAAVLAHSRLYNRSTLTDGTELSASDTSPQTLGSFNGNTPPAFDSSGLGFYMNNATLGTLEAHAVSGDGFGWAFGGDGSLASEPVVANGYVYVGTAKGNLFVLNETTGRPVWWTNLGAPFRPPADDASEDPSAGLAIGLGMLVTPVGNRLLALTSGGTAPTSALPLASAAPALPQQNYFWSTLSSAGSASDVGVAGLQNAWAIGTNAVPGGFGIYQWAWSELHQDYEWTRVTGGALRVAVASDGQPWIVNAAGRIYERWGNRWILLPGLARDIGAGGDGSIWVIGTNAVPGGYGLWRWAPGTGGWQAVPGGAVAISVDPAGNAWVVNANGAIWLYNQSGWHHIPGCAHDIGVANSSTPSVWIVSCNPTAGGYAVDYLDPSTMSWQAVNGEPAVRIAVASNGYPWMVSQDGSVYTRED